MADPKETVNGNGQGLPQGGNPNDKANANNGNSGDQRIDYNADPNVQAIISQRDTANTNVQKLNDELEELKYVLYKGKAVDKWEKDYPDVPRKELEKIEDPGQLEQFVKEYREDRAKLKDEIRAELQMIPGVPTLTDVEKQEKLSGLKDSGDLEGAIALKMAK